MKKVAALISIVLLIGNLSFAATTCGNPSVINDTAVEYGVEILEAKIEEANIYGDAKTRLAPIAQIVKSKNQAVIKLMECLAFHGKIAINLDIVTLKEKLNELAYLESGIIPNGGRFNPTQEEIRIFYSAIEAMKLNRLAKAYITNFTAIKKK